MTEQDNVQVQTDQPEAKPQRSRAEIDRDYQQTAALAGDKSYRLLILTKERDDLYQKMWELNQEAKKLENANPPAEAQS